MPFPGRRLAAAVSALLAAAALAAGCGGGGDAGEDRTAGLTPAQVLAESARAAAGLDSFRIALEARGHIDAPGLAGPAADLLSGPLDLSGEGAVAPPDRASLDTSVRVGGLPVQVNVTRVGDDVFLGALGQDVRLALPPAQAGLLELDELYPTLVGWIAEPAERGREEIDGQEAVRIGGPIDPARALADLGPLIGAGDVRPSEAAAALRRGEVEAWIGTEDLLPRRVTLALDADGSRVAGGLGEVRLDLRADLSAFGEPVEIEAPAGARPLDPRELGGLVGG